MKVQEFVSLLFEIEVNTHIMHLQTGSLAQHLALNDLYQGMPELRDHFCEAYQGEYTIIKGYKAVEIKEGLDPVKYLQECCTQIEAFRGTLHEGYLQQIVDDILDAIYSQVYKLRFLK